MKPISWFFISYQDSYFVFKGFLALSFKDQFAPVIVSSFVSLFDLLVVYHYYI